MRAGWIRKTMLVATAAFLAAFLLATVAQAANYPPKPPSIGVGSTIVRAGDDLVVTGADWCPGSTVDIYFNGKFITTADVGNDGTFRTTIKVPAGTPTGPAEVTVKGKDETCQSPRTLGRTVTVIAGGARADGTLPFTGGNLSVWMVLLAALILMGGAFALVNRRRENRARR